MPIKNQKPIDQEPLNDALVIDSRINQKFIVDYGIVKNIVDDSHVDITHAVQLVLRTGEELPPLESLNVEVLFPSSSKFSIKYPLSIGDGVLLVGLKNYLESTLNIQPQVPNAIRHYSRDTIKAIPVSAIPSMSTVQIIVDNTGALSISSVGAALNAGTGLVSIKNQTQSLFTQLNTLLTDLTVLVTGLQTFTTGLNVGTLSGQAAAMASVSGTTLSNLSSAITNLALLLEA